jgi:hypothetical protein
MANGDKGAGLKIDRFNCQEYWDECLQYYNNIESYLSTAKSC